MSDNNYNTVKIGYNDHGAQVNFSGPWDRVAYTMSDNNYNKK
jgi:hypothetical protein